MGNKCTVVQSWNDEFAEMTGLADVSLLIQIWTYGCYSYILWPIYLIFNEMSQSWNYVYYVHFSGHLLELKRIDLKMSFYKDIQDKTSKA